MSDKAVMPISLGDVSMDMDKNDVLAIAISRAEEMMNARISECRRDTKAINDRIEQIKEDCAKVYTDHALPIAEHFIEDYKALLTKYGFPVVKMEYEVIPLKEEPEKYSLRIHEKTDSRYAKTFFDKTVSLPEADVNRVAALKEDLKGAYLDLEGINEIHADWRKRLADIGRLERKLRGRLAEHRLIQVDGGKEVLALLTENLEKDVLMLTA